MSIDFLTHHRIQGTYVPSTTSPENTHRAIIQRNGISIEKSPSLGKRALEFLRNLFKRSTVRPAFKLQLATKPTLLGIFREARLLCVTSARRTHIAERLMTPGLKIPAGRILHDYDMHWEKVFSELCDGRSFNHTQLFYAAREADFLTCHFFTARCAYTDEIDIAFFYSTWKSSYSLLADMPSGQQFNQPIQRSQR